MPLNPEVIAHLEAARDAIDQQIASISIQGRALTPEEEELLGRLELAGEDVDSALDHLTAVGPSLGGPTLVEPQAQPLPADGRYRLSNDAVSLELRVDLEVSGIVSADVFALGDGHREHVASLRSRPGLELTSASNPLAVVVADVDGRRAEGTLSLSGGGEAGAVLTVDEQIKALPLAQPMSFVGRFEGRAMRTLGLELETETGTVADVEWPFEGDFVTIESCLGDAGFEVSRVGHRNQIPAPSGGRWDDSQLHGLMTQFAQEPLDRRSWNLHVLMLQLSRLNGLNGVMFDSGDSDLNHLPRQGAAIFQHEIKFPIIDGDGNRSPAPRPDWQRKLIQTTVHELGHALNLAHRFERELGRADSLSFMNYDWRYKGGGNKTNFWRDFGFTFDPDELAFMRHGPRDAVIPGGAEFRTVPYWENTDGGYSPYRVEVPTDELKLNLLPPASGNLFQFGQPVLLTVELINNTGQVLDLPRRLIDPKSGFLQFVVHRTNPLNDGGGDSLDFNPIVHRCYDLSPALSDMVEPAGKLTNNVNLTFGSAGFTFMEPGNYEVTAVFSLPIPQRRALVAESAPLRLRIAYPKSDDEERDGLRLFRHDVGLYLALGGSDVLPEAEDALNEIVERRQKRRKTITDPLVTNILRCQAINHSREFVRYEGGRFNVRDARPEQAKKLFDSISRASAKVFDHHTQKEIRELAKAQDEADK